MNGWMQCIGNSDRNERYRRDNKKVKRKLTVSDSSCINEWKNKELL